VEGKPESVPESNLPNPSDALFKETFSDLPSCRSFIESTRPDLHKEDTEHRRLIFEVWF
jgi:hypothetical protein